jgi:hypothetical protein
MGYYDNVKDNVRNDSSPNSGDSTASTESSGNFETLKQAADKDTEGDDTPIEVLDEDGISREKPRESTGQRSEGGTDSGNPLQEAAGDGNPNTGNVNTSGIEEKLDTIIEQNKELIEILRGFGQ